MSNPLAIGVLMDEDTLDLPDFTRMQQGARMIAQRVRVRTLTHRGDWVLDKNAGLDWLDFMSQKPPDAEGFAADLADEWASTPGVLSVENLTWTVEGQAVTFTADLEIETGETLSVVVAAPDPDGNVSIALGAVIATAGYLVM